MRKSCLQVYNILYIWRCRLYARIYGFDLLQNVYRGIFFSRKLLISTRKQFSNCLQRNLISEASLFMGEIFFNILSRIFHLNFLLSCNLVNLMQQHFWLQQYIHNQSLIVILACFVYFFLINIEIIFYFTFYRINTFARCALFVPNSSKIFSFVISTYYNKYINNQNVYIILSGSAPKSLSI